MTSQTLSSEFSTTSQTDFAVLRSNWLDEFAEFEILVCRCLRKSGNDGDPKNAPFAQRLKTLPNVKPSPHLSKAVVTAFAKVASEADPILKWRAATVHSRMEIGNRNGTDVAMFRNVVNEVNGTPDYVVLSREDFKRLAEKLDELAKPLREYVSRPSSPPQPAPAAAAGP